MALKPAWITAEETVRAIAAKRSAGYERKAHNE
jgi:hypothetical protein